VVALDKADLVGSLAKLDKRVVSTRQVGIGRVIERSPTDTQI
jgi:hypothetical protein